MADPCWDQGQLVNRTLQYFDRSVNPAGNPTSLPLTIRHGIDTSTANFTDVCGYYIDTYAKKLDPDGELSYVVVNVKQLVSTNPLSPTTIYISSCDGSVAYNVTKPGTFVIAHNAVIFVQRAPLVKGKLANSTDCAGNDMVQYEYAPWTDYCLEHRDIPACDAYSPLDSYQNPALTVSLSTAPPPSSDTPHYLFGKEGFALLLPLSWT